MAKCPECKGSFEQPTLAIIKGGPKLGMLRPMMATCPKCDVVLRIFGL